VRPEGLKNKAHRLGEGVRTRSSSELQSLTLHPTDLVLFMYSDTVKPFNLAALKAGDLACKIILAN